MTRRPRDPNEPIAPAAPSAKRPYRAPRLVVYGKLAELTKVTGGTKGDNDNAKQFNKTW